jgi:hypothetical protein
MPTHKCTQILHDSKRLQVTRLLILRGKIKNGSSRVLWNPCRGGFDSRLGHFLLPLKRDFAQSLYDKSKTSLPNGGVAEG